MNKTFLVVKYQELWTINNLWFVLILAILTFLITYLSGEGKLYVRGNGILRKKLTKKGWIAIIGILFIVIMCLQELNNNRISTNKDIELSIKETQLKNEQKHRDSIITAGINAGVTTANQNLFQNLTVAFQNQGLQYDSIKNQINTIKISNNVPPLLHVKSLELVDNSHKYNRYTFVYEIVSDNAVSYNTNLLFDIYGFTTEGRIISLDFNKNVLYKGQTVAKDLSVKGNLTVIVNYNISTYAFRLKGNYKSSDGTKIPIDEFTLLQMNNTYKSLELTSQYYENALREFIKENKFN